MRLLVRDLRADFTEGLRFTIRWFGWLGLLILILTLVGLRVWWAWDRAQQVPIPPHAQNVSSQLIEALTKQTTFITQQPVREVRAFYRHILQERGWAYCGTQATRGCTNLITQVGGLSAQVDVYRRPADHDRTRSSIEVWPRRNVHGQTYVVIWEANRFPRQWE